MIPLGRLLVFVITGSAVVLTVAVYALTALSRTARELAAAREALTSRLAELATLEALGRDLATTHEPERILSIVERECRKVLPADEFLLGIVDRNAREVTVRAPATGDPVARSSVVPVASGPFASVLREKRPQRIDGVADDSAMRSALVAPLLAADGVIGFVAVRCREPHAYDDHQLAVFVSLASPTSLAVEGARDARAATTDLISGLGRRELFLRRLAEEHTRAKRYHGRFVVLVLDLDGFRTLNDQHGFEAGNAYLRGVGDTLRHHLRTVDVPCRFGDDAFSILLPETGLAGGRAIAERLRGAIAGLVVTVDGAILRATASIGAAAHPEHDSGEARTLLLRADQALHRAKREGRNRVVFFAP
jgi:diguanylate cyclase (GGDEF)-like protein